MVRREKGFSVIELLVAFVILGILASIAVPGFTRWLPSRRLKSAAMDLYSNLQLAKTGAVRDNGEWALVFDAANSRYEVISGGPDGDYWDAGDNVVRKIVNLSDYKSGLDFGNGSATTAFDMIVGFENGITFDDAAGGDNDDDILVFNSRGMINEQVHADGEVYLQNSENGSFVVSAGASGAILLRKWNGTGWE